MEGGTQTPKGPHMSIDITQQALNALADAGLGNDLSLIHISEPTRQIK